MRNTLPTSNLVLGYTNLLGKEPPNDRLSLIRNISKNSLLLELAGLNFRLRGKFAKEIDSTLATQQQELFRFCGKNPALFNKYANAANKFTDGKKTNLFSRPAVTFAMEEIIQSDIPEIPDYIISKLSEWESILQYLLAVNEHITAYQNLKPDEPVTFESLNPYLLPLSEMLLVSDPLYTLHRGLVLLDYLSKHEETADFLKEYISQTYKTTYEIFIRESYRMYFANEQQNPELNFYYQIPKTDPYLYFFDVMSKRTVCQDINKLIGIKKSPFYKNSRDEYILTDNILLLDKAYQQLINDFWFDYLTGKQGKNGKPYKFQDYKSVIGRFFETYVDGLLRKAFDNQRDFVLKTLDQLKVKVKKQESDTADFYVRHFRKIIIGEIKSTSIYDEQKFGGNVELLYKNNRNEFFKKYGVDQLVEYITNLKTFLKDIDPELAGKKRMKIRIWPVIIFNEKVFQTPLMAPVFNKRFKELLGDTKLPGMHIYPLTIMHVGDLEQMHQELYQRPYRIWNLLSRNFLGTKFLPPFYITLNRNHIKHKYDTVRKRVFDILEP